MELKQYFLQSETNLKEAIPLWKNLSSEDRQNLFLEVFIECLKDCEKYATIVESGHSNTKVQIATLPFLDDEQRRKSKLFAPLYDMVALSQKTPVKSRDFLDYALDVLSSYFLSPFQSPPQPYYIRTKSSQYDATIVYVTAIEMLDNVYSVLADGLQQQKTIKSLIQIPLHLEVAREYHLKIRHLLTFDEFGLGKAPPSENLELVMKAGLEVIEFILKNPLPSRYDYIQEMVTMVSSVATYSNRAHQMDNQNNAQDRGEHEQYIFMEYQRLFEYIQQTIKTEAVDEQAIDCYFEFVRAWIGSGMRHWDDGLAAQVLKAWCQTLDSKQLLTSPPAMIFFPSHSMYIDPFSEGSVVPPEVETAAKELIKTQLDAGIQMMTLLHTCRYTAVEHQDESGLLGELLKALNSESPYRRRNAFRCLMLQIRRAGSYWHESNLQIPAFDSIVQLLNQPQFIIEMSHCWHLTPMKFVTEMDTETMLQKLTEGLQNYIYSGRDPSHLKSGGLGRAFAFCQNSGGEQSLLQLLDDLHSAQPCVKKVLTLKELAARKIDANSILDNLRVPQELQVYVMEYHKQMQKSKKAFTNLLLAILQYWEVEFKETSVGIALNFFSKLADYTDTFQIVERTIDLTAKLLALSSVSDDDAIMLVSSIWRYINKGLEENIFIGVVQYWRESVNEQFPLLQLIFDRFGDDGYHNAYSGALTDLVNRNQCVQEVRHLAVAKLPVVLPSLIGNRPSGFHHYLNFLAALFGDHNEEFFKIAREVFPDMLADKVEHLLDAILECNAHTVATLFGQQRPKKRKRGDIFVGDYSKWRPWSRNFHSEESDAEREREREHNRKLWAQLGMDPPSLNDDEYLAQQQYEDSDDD